MENRKELVLKAKLAYIVVGIVEDEEDSDVWCISFNYDKDEQIIIANTHVTYMRHDNMLIFEFIKNKVRILETGSFDIDRIMLLLDRLSTEYLEKINKSIAEKNIVNG